MVQQKNDGDDLTAAAVVEMKNVDAFQGCLRRRTVRTTCVEVGGEAEEAGRVLISFPEKEIGRKNQYRGHKPSA